MNYFKYFLFGFTIYAQHTIGGTVDSRNFTWGSNIDSVNSKGYHRILLNSEVVNRLNYNSSDIRIYDNNEKQVPYLFDTDSRKQTSTHFDAYEILDSKKVKGRYSWLIISNPGRQSIDKLLIRVKNFRGSKRVKINGSDNLKDWYMVRDSYLMGSADGGIQDYDTKVMSFPRSNYKYYRFEVGDSSNYPVNILSIGKYVSTRSRGNYSKVNCPAQQRKDTVEIQETIINYDFDRPVYFEKIAFEISHSSHFYRDTRVYIKTVLSDSTIQRRSVGSLWLSSSGMNELNTSFTKADGIEIRIINYDDLPLDTVKMELFQLRRYLTANLEPEQSYTLKFGNKDVAKPKYDLVHFRNKIPGILNTINVGLPIEINFSEEIEKAESVFKDKKLVWITIGALVLLFGFMSVKMMKEMRSKDEESN